MAKKKTSPNGLASYGLTYMAITGYHVAMDQRTSLITLAETLAAHRGVTHFAISMRALRKGDFFKNMIEKGSDCRTQTAAKLFLWFSENWPDDLEWPRHIPRPSKTKREAA